MSKHLVASIDGSPVTPRMLCDALLSSDQLQYDNPHFWTAAFTLVRRIIGGVDYKGVREGMKNCIDKVLTLPQDINPKVKPTLKVKLSNMAKLFLKHFMFSHKNPLSSDNCDTHL